MKETHRLVLAGMALELHDEGVMSSLRSLERDVRFWRMILGSARNLVNKMMAVGVLSRDVRFLSGVARSFDLGAEEAALAARILQPLLPEERSLKGTMGSQCALGIQMIAKTFAEAQSKKGRVFFKEQATKNLVYRQFRDESALFSLPAKSFHEGAEQSRDRKIRRNPFYYLYNPVGKLVLQISRPDINAFQYRPHGLDGFLSLVRLQLSAKGRSLSPGGLPVFLEGSCPPECNPCTLRPFDWAPGKSSLSFSDPVGGRSIVIGPLTGRATASSKG